MSNQLATQGPAQKPSSLRTMAARLNVEAETLMSTLKATVCKSCSDAEVMAFTIVANEYGLNPFTKQIYAFPAKGGGIVPVVSIDGWISMANNHPQMDGLEFEDAHDEQGNLSAIICTIYRKDRSRPVRVAEYLKECIRPTDPWKMPHRMLRHKALIQCARVAFGFAGITDDDEADDIMRNGGMRDAVGREVDQPGPKVISGGTTQPAATEAPKTRTKTKPAAQAATVEVAAEDASEGEQAATAMPTRDEMRNGIRAAIGSAKLSVQSAQTKYRAAGLLKGAQDLSDTTDAELFAIYQRPDLLASKPAATTEAGGDQ